MINNPPPFKGLNLRLPIIIPSFIPIKRRGSSNQGSGLGRLYASWRIGYPLGYYQGFFGVIWG